MASVHKRPESRFWHAAWRGGDGRLHLRSTKQAEKSKALSLALEWERIDKKVGTGNMVESQVRKVINDIMERIGEPVIEVPITKQWLKEWVDEKEATKSEGTGVRYRGVIDDFLDHLGPIADKPLTTLVSRHIQTFIAKRRKEGVSSTTAHLDAKIIRTALNRARRQGVIPTNPAEAVDLPEKDSVERGVFTEGEVKLLVDESKGTEWETLILFGYYTGARLGDCTKMKWDNIDFAIGTLTYFQAKNRKNVIIPLHPELQGHLEGLAASDKPEEFITPHMSTLGPGGRHGLSEGFKRIVTKAGLDLQTVQGSGIRKISKRTFHALRHSFTSALANAGVAPELRMKLTGHKSAEVHKGYTHLELNTLKEAIQKLPCLTLAKLIEKPDS